MNDNRIRNPFVPWYGTENMETDEPIVTSCGKTVEPIRIPGGSGEKANFLPLGESVEKLAAEMKSETRKARTVSQMLKVANARRDWSNYEI